jgi:hypothetical protein
VTCCLFWSWYACIVLSIQCKRCFPFDLMSLVGSTILERLFINLISYSFFWKLLILWMWYNWNIVVIDSWMRKTIFPLVLWGKSGNSCNWWAVVMLSWWLGANVLRVVHRLKERWWKR